MATHALSPKFRRAIRRTLERERDRLRQRIQSLAELGRSLGEGEGEESGPGGGRADVASDVFEHELDLTLEHLERRRLGEVMEALGRLRNDEYGSCLTCGKPIDVERLKVLPWTEKCVTCAGQHAVVGYARQR